MLAPHNGKNSQLSEVRFASEDFLDALELFRRQAVLGHELGTNRWNDSRLGHRHCTLADVGRDTTRSFLRYASNIRAARRVESLKPLKPKRKGTHEKHPIEYCLCTGGSVRVCANNDYDDRANGDTADNHHRNNHNLYGRHGNH